MARFFGGKMKIIYPSGVSVAMSQVNHLVSDESAIYFFKTVEDKKWLARLEKSSGVLICVDHLATRTENEPAKLTGERALAYVVDNVETEFRYKKGWLKTLKEKLTNFNAKTGYWK
jgi:hypothetical protein